MVIRCPYLNAVNYKVKRPATLAEGGQWDRHQCLCSRRVTPSGRRACTIASANCLDATELSSLSNQTVRSVTGRRSRTATVLAMSRSMFVESPHRVRRDPDQPMVTTSPPSDNASRCHGEPRYSPRGASFNNRIRCGCSQFRPRDEARSARTLRQPGATAPR